MEGTYYNEKDFPKLHIDDPYVETNDGRRWLKISNVGHRTSCNSFKFKDRLNNNIELADGTVIPLYKIKDCILIGFKLFKSDIHQLNHMYFVDVFFYIFS